MEHGTSSSTREESLMGGATATPTTSNVGNGSSSHGGATQGGSNIVPSPYQHRGEDCPARAAEEDEDGEEDGGEAPLSLNELMYGASSYHAIAKPVSLTMILAALCVVYINTEASRSLGEQEMSAYTVFKIDSTSQSKTEALELSLLNALIIVTVICCMTFGIVILYKYRCMACLLGYMMLSSSTLLGFLGGTMFAVAIDKYRLPLDMLSFVFFLFNFAIVGTTSIFYQRGIPTYITQAYLVATSVILAWQLSHFDAWTTWTLLVMLALYDLCAVLTPCGPLRALVNLMSEDGSPDMPGLLYEARLPEGTRRPTGPPPASSSPPSGQGNAQDPEEAVGRASVSSTTTRHPQNDDSVDCSSNTTARRESACASSVVSYPSHQSPTVQSNASSSAFPVDVRTGQDGGTVELSRTAAGTTTSSQASTASASASTSTAYAPLPTPSSNSLPPPNASAASTNTTLVVGEESHPPTGFVPLAIARLYRLPLYTAPTPLLLPVAEDGTTGGGGGGGDSNQSRRSMSSTSSTVSASPLLENNHNATTTTTAPPTTTTTDANGNPSAVPHWQQQRQLTPAELRAEVEVIYPRNGGKIVRRSDSSSSTGGSVSSQLEGFPRYLVLGRDGDVRRVLVVDHQGRVFQETDDDSDGSSTDSDEEKAASIRLGLGDFIFYSVLVSRAAIYSFTTFIACMLVILAGLGGTLVLLSVYHKALPALPISIFLGVVFYLLTRGVIEPWIEGLLMVPFYV